MLSNQILHKAVQDIKRITGLECAVWDMKGICLVMTNERMTSLDQAVAKFCGAGALFWGVGHNFMIFNYCL